MCLKSLTIVFSLFVSLAFGQQQNRKSIATTRAKTPPIIDGILNDVAWKNTEVCKDFTEFRPNNGEKVPNEYATEVRVVYNDDAVYIAAKMLDPDPKGIPQEFTTRDKPSQADFFLVTINPNDDGQNSFQFIVQSTGNQGDAKVSNGNEDFNWSAVWESKAIITDKGWNVEMKIPYRALRFANQPVQSWGFNFHRRLERLNAQHTWNYINNTVGNWTQYDGLITNFENISPPTRLNLYPYASFNTNTYDGHTIADWSVGMDIKYGVSENFTLDATLIPDFSQAGFDNVQLNLGPFEQQFSEQRQFFTEGTDLFTKGGLFYSRRIGGTPEFVPSLNDDETFIANPEKVSMLNAIKISGRTKNGLGLGFFNAITEETEAVVKNNESDEIRKVVTSPFTNYNIIVADYQFNSNSSVTAINTNVTRDGSYRDANATGLLWHIEDKTSTYNVDGSFKMTHISDDTANKTPGYMFDTSIGKHSGNWFWEVGYNFENKDYNPNDLGILFSNNKQLLYSSVGYRMLKPKGQLNNFNINFFQNAQFQHYSGVFTRYNAGLNFWVNLKSRFSLGQRINYRTVLKDFFEPRQGSLSSIYFNQPERISFKHWGSSNYQKKMAIDYDFYTAIFKNNPKLSYGFSVIPRYRFSNQLSVRYGFKYNNTENDRGYVDEDNTANKIFIGQRNRTNYSNTISGKYSFSTNSSLSLSFRHNWSKVDYDGNYFNLSKKGILTNEPNFEGVDDINFNQWNLDLNYIWQFAPGSQLVALYRNTILNQNSTTEIDFFDNIGQLFEQPNTHIFSLRVVYFIDYNTIRNVFEI